MAKLLGNPFFTIERLEDGVWAAIVIPGSGAVANASIIDLGDITVVVDTFCLPEAAQYLREAAEKLTGKPVKYIVNTHFHGDHHYGNQIFTDSIIISTEQTKEFLIQNAPAETTIWQAGLRNQIEGLTEVRNAATDLRVQTGLEHEIADKEKLLAATPEIRRVSASITFSEELMIYGSARSIRLFTYGGGHTISDALVYVPDAKVLIAGDLILGNSHPAMQNGDPAAWIGILEQIENGINFTQVIPGHGEVTDRRSILEMKSYLTEIQGYAKKAVESGETEDFWLEKGIPAPFDAWLMSYIFEWNFHWLFNKIINEEQELNHDRTRE